MEPDPFRPEVSYREHRRDLIILQRGGGVLSRGRAFFVCPYLYTIT
jgi:hypothetical protein